MKLHGVKRMNKRMQKAFKKATGIKITMKLNSDFYYYPATEEISYTPIMSCRSNKLFSDFIKDYFNLELKSDVEIFCLSALHEIGHHLTYDTIDNEDYNYSKDEEESIAQALKNNPDDDVTYSRYFSLPLEIIATEWAVDFIKQNPLSFDKLVKQIYLILLDFYHQNLKNDDEYER